MALMIKNAGERARRAAHTDPILVIAFQHGYFPKAFVWRGKQHTVEAVERCWTVVSQDKAGRPGPAAQHAFRVRCPEGRYNLYQDLTRDTWYIDRRTEGVS